ncbi:MAG: spore coat associated protein CotJA [Ruminiclostridium sp.]|nr:spore coat associated protein CotJA [Ruminiclostridium sp.]
MNSNECGMERMPDMTCGNVGYAYVPFQKLGRVYTPERAMQQGTVFPELDIGIGEYERGLYDGR